MSPKTLITGASSGIGAVYADRLARRGHDPVLVARDQARLDMLAHDLHARSGVAVEVLRADLTDDADITRVADRLREDGDISMLINNAGAGLGGLVADQHATDIARLIALNTTAVTLLAHAAATRFSRQGSGTIVTIGSVVGLVPEFANTVYGATKAFVMFLSQGLAVELAPRGVRVQAVLPAATRTELWDRAGADPSGLPPMMEAADLVDAALAGLDAGEAVTIPALGDAGLWDAYQKAREAMLPDFANTRPAPRYGA